MGKLLDVIEPPAELTQFDQPVHTKNGNSCFFFLVLNCFNINRLLAYVTIGGGRGGSSRASNRGSFGVYRGRGDSSSSRGGRGDFSGGRGGRFVFRTQMCFFCFSLSFNFVSIVFNLDIGFLFFFFLTFLFSSFCKM